LAEKTYKWTYNWHY